MRREQETFANHASGRPMAMLYSIQVPLCECSLDIRVSHDEMYTLSVRFHRPDDARVPRSPKQILDPQHGHSPPSLAPTDELTTLNKK